MVLQGRRRRHDDDGGSTIYYYEHGSPIIHNNHHVFTDDELDQYTAHVINAATVYNQHVNDIKRAALEQLHNNDAADHGSADDYAAHYWQHPSVAVIDAARNRPR